MQRFTDFLKDWDDKVRSSNANIELFQANVAPRLTDEQKVAFVKVFYHLRGHFHDFLWYLGNTAQTGEEKKVIVANIMEEFGGGRVSHERLYFDFAKQFGVNIEQEEILNEESYLPFARSFNKGHIEWLVNHPWSARVATFAAYERLDNVDYSTLMKFAQNIGAKDDALTFFEVHTKVQHFESAYYRMGLEAIWSEDTQTVIDSFEFIRRHQEDMWRDLSAHVLNG